VAAYYLLPFNHLSEASSLLPLVLGMVGVLLIVAWEVRGILNSQYPAVKAVEALAITAPLFLLLFATAYYLVERSAPSNFSQPLSRTDSLYFTVTTFSTVGYGDITAKSEAARLMVVVQMLADLVVLGFGVKVIFGAVEMGRQRQATPTTDDG
jgi:voltage-gated potassium channel Kch